VTDKKTISVVMPAYNEEGNISRAYDEITAAFKRLPDYDYEVIIVDNASTDTTGELARDICAKDAHWKYLRFSRNFGAETSITIGMRLASGDAVINVFSDLQDPPACIPDFVRKWEEGYDVVYGVIKEREDSWKLRGFFARLAYKLIRVCSDIDIPVNAGDFRLNDRRVVDAFNQMEERERFVRGMMHWVGYKRIALPYDRRSRQWGRSKAPFWWCFYFTLNAITSFSNKPLRLFTFFGLIVLTGSLMLSGFYIVGKFLTAPPRGVTAMLVLLSWNLAVVSLGIGILGEYVGHIFTETKRRPKCFVDRYENLPDEIVEEALAN